MFETGPEILCYSKALRSLWGCPSIDHIFFFTLFFNFYFTLQYCIGFAIHWHESATGVHEFPNMKPPPTSHPISSLFTLITEEGFLIHSSSRTSRLFPCPGYYKQCCDEHWGLLDSEEEGEGGMIWRMALKRILSSKKRIASLCSIQDTGCLGLVHRDDPERWYVVGGGRVVHDCELMYTRGRFMSMYGKTNTVL